MYVGQPEYDAGYAAGLRAAGDGVGRFLCVNHYISSPSSTERCQGFADGLGVDLGNQMIDIPARTRPKSRTGCWPISTPTRTPTPS
jgi:ABC-type sugar transport system substrate-binding protein